MCEKSPLVRPEDVAEVLDKFKREIEEGDLEGLATLSSATVKSLVAVNAVATIREIYKLALRSPYDGTYYYLPSKCCQSLAEALAVVRMYASDPVVRILLSQIRFEPGCKIHRDVVNAMAQLFARIWTLA